ncbi:hypothetical protein [Maribacter sp. HTCC2170]|uniref:beta-propeller domain-containing protein n=1 Tax=Maribacter sp. (strain HTCC2170 / KCCM 42371) TaxID=313603 RepID=UPI00006BD421|nr:hypothetical protein [Maribacter sp. HTCC2170]EAR02516.1 hypothetical protein FB2170_04495 [Maribacter sp. HTCC2170]
MKLFSKALLLLMLPLALFGQKSQQDTKHSFFIAGPQFTGVIGEENQVIWDSQKPGARDGYVLKNGNVLICWADEVREYDSNKKVIFNYHRKEESMELGTAIRLRNGNTMITESGNNPRIIEVNKKGVIVETVPLLPETDNVHMQTRMARKLKNGNYLVPHLLAFTVKEYTPQGKVIQEFKTDVSSLGGREAENWPFTAIRLKNGNTLITLTHGNKVVEMDAAGNIVWKISNEDFKGNPLVDPCGAQRLPNGNTVIASYGARNGIKLIEVDRTKNVIWKYEGNNAHHFQILTTSGKPVKGKPLK